MIGRERFTETHRKNRSRLQSDHVRLVQAGNRYCLLAAGEACGSGCAAPVLSVFVYRSGAIAGAAGCSGGVFFGHLTIGRDMERRVSQPHGQTRGGRLGRRDGSAPLWMRLLNRLGGGLTSASEVSGAGGVRRPEPGGTAARHSAVIVWHGRRRADISLTRT